MPIAIGSVLAAAGIRVLLAPSPEPKLAMGTLNYGYWNGPSVTVRLGITNVGQSSIRYNQINFGEALVRTEMAYGWTTGNNAPISLAPGAPALLRPGSNTVALVVLDRDMLRWQIAYTIRRASRRDRVLDAFPVKWRTYARPILGGIFSGKEGPEKRVQSDIFERPHHVKWAPN